MFPNLFTQSTPDKCPQAYIAREERVYAIGDIHGRQDLLEAMLAKISDDIARFSDDRRPRVVFLGDYIDRGDDSRAVLQTLSGIFHIADRLKSETNLQIDFLVGNHEVALLEFLKNPITSSAWLDWGGLQTLASFGVSPTTANAGARDFQRVRDQLAEKLEPYMGFLEGLPRTVVSGKVVFVHASLDPACSLDAQPDEATLWGTPPSGRAMGMPGMRMVHGHFAASKPVSRPNRICVDTGAYYSGCLTAIRLDESEAFLKVTSADLSPISGLRQSGGGSAFTV